MWEIPTGLGRMNAKYRARAGRRHLALSQFIEHDQIVAKRGKPSMPKLAFMNGTKWGKIVGDNEPESWAA